MPNSDYVPTPVNLNNVILPEELIKLTENLARNTHEVWAKTRLEQGWKWGETRDDARKLHPCLVPYENLTEKEKTFDRNTAMETLRFILALGFKITKDESSKFPQETNNSLPKP